MEKRRGGAEEVMSPVPDPPQAEEPQPTRHASTASLSLERLPDDALVLVLQHLDVPSLLTCRVVSKRLGALALHRDSWRHRVVGGHVLVRSCVCPELRLAPCVRVLRVSTNFNKPPPCLQVALAWTRCAAAELRLDVHQGAGDAQAAAALIYRQEALGRLRSIRLFMSFFSNAADLSLAAAAAMTPGVEKLEVSVLALGVQTTPLRHDCVVLTPSLRYFKCQLNPKTAPYVNFVLAGHAATLETVELGCGLDSMACVATGPLLARLPKLSKLICWNIPGVEDVAACGSLRDLQLTVRTETEHRGAVAGAAALLRRASQLLKIKVTYSPGTPDVDVDVVRALGSSGRACVESLEIYNWTDDNHWHHFCHLQELISAIPSLPALRHLRVGVNSVQQLDELARAITSTTAPALRTVDLGLGKGACGHAWLHGDAFQSLMSMNPLLHFSLDSLPLYCADDEFCQACGQGCHVIVKKPEGFDFHLFWHDFDTNCPQEHSVKSHQFQWVLF
ncbi:uncharacterized protein LOC113214181 isoform X2 [Frankliniella occidentalis]|uniref:Uncharacterized protein LOC113214181 isoform X2 n=1 Tax=Frankliniella occidentalis TaxID=133901 RepID=A0A9C6X6I5_FRAOC|nr:uncharacterized protein LOC113214181 isoform X2 [Frankliniella occidentalis]